MIVRLWDQEEKGEVGLTQLSSDLVIRKTGDSFRPMRMELEGRACHPFKEVLSCPTFGDSAFIVHRKHKQTKKLNQNKKLQPTWLSKPAPPPATIAA